MSPARATAVLIGVTAAIRLAVAAATGLGVDESFMVANSRELAASYVDHPPLHVWLVAAMRAVSGSESAGVLRIPFVALFAGSTALLYRLTAGLFGPRAGWWAAVAFNLAPVFTLSTGSWILPDGPLVFFDLAAAVVLAPLLIGAPPVGSAPVDRSEAAPLGRIGPPATGLGRWLAGGVLLGLALLSKYHAAFLLVALFAALATSPGGRRALRRPGPWVAAGAALVAFAPVVLWNAEHDWLGLRFQADRLASPSVRPLRLLGDLAGQAAYLTPWIAAGLVVALVRALRRGPADPRSWSLALAALGPVGFFGVAALLARGFPHWPMPGWLFGFPLLGAWCASFQGRSARILRGVAGGWAALLLVLVGALASHAATGWITSVAPRFSGPSDPTVDLVDWGELPEALRGRGLLDGDTVVAATHWTEAGKASYALGPAVPVLCLCPGPDQFELRAGARGHEGDDVLIVGTERFLDARDPSRWFERVEVLEPVAVTRGGREVLTLQVRRGVGLKAGYLDPRTRAEVPQDRRRTGAAANPPD